MRRRLAAVPGVVLIAVAAAMWGTDPVIRKTMSSGTSATTIVFGEHVILVALTLPLLLPALRAVFHAGWRCVAAAVVVGAGASAIATILFTDALIGHYDFITPVVIQKIQPFVAVAGAALLLKERPRPRFAWFFLAGVVGFWLVNQADPFHPSAQGVVVIAEATGAAVLWAMGTVLGRYLTREIEFQAVLALRFFFGLIASAIALPVMRAGAYSNGHDSLLILYLALVTGLFALVLYYYGLQKTPAVLATLGELTFPAVFVIAGIYGRSQPLTWSQWLGVAVILGTVTLLPVQRRRDVVLVPEPAPA
ncbi:MAG: putative blue pigment (indigoidine) exporter [Gaiellaceae bacterium]|jgi:drug/metabolite transporter (DMT)-like permease|nr:putative blue pigment (indigoidine) exporter [Gaiellaceae bacterium]